jgi:hypothetical protein
MLVLLIPAAWLAAMCFGVAVCRLAAISDESDAAALEEWLATRPPADQFPGRADDPVPLDHPGAYRATG